MAECDKSLAARLTAPVGWRSERGPSERYREIVADHAGLSTIAPPGSSAAAVLDTVFAASPYLTGLIARNPDATAEELAADPVLMLDGILADGEERVAEAGDEKEVQAALRRARARASRIIALADIGGAWPVETVIAKLSETADRITSAAVDWLLRQAARSGRLDIANPEHPADGSGYIILALGKLGGGELNFSSDIDLIALFDRERAPLGEDIEPQTFFVRVTRDLVRLLQESTSDGYAYRTDLRLRPDPGATNVAISVSAAEQYYESLGQNWERAAMIKARPIAGDIAAGNAFLAELSPFVWRRYLDFAAIADVHSIKRQIQAYRGHAEITVAGHNIKLGRGGIREIEFFVQTQQLIAGGRQPELRGRSTLDMLRVLESCGWIDAAARDELAAAYRFLRVVENRLQMMGDQQTHTVPQQEDELAKLALIAGFENVETFGDALRHHMRAVERHYSALFESAPRLGGETGPLVFTGGEDDPATLETLSSMGFRDPALISRTVRDWHYGRYNATRSATARERLTELMPALLSAFAGSENPDYAFIAFDRFLQGLPAGVQLFSLLCANPDLLGLLAEVMGTSPRLARTLSEHPRTLEEAVLDPEFFSALPDEAQYAALAQEAVGPARGMEDALDRARTFGREHLFRIGIRQLAGTAGAPEAGTAYSALASGLIGALLGQVETDLADRHGRMPGGEVAVIGMGKLGSREMTATSDLDLILIYDLPEETEASDGEKPLYPAQYYTRFTQRLISAISAPTAEGRLFEVDMRLRPSGRSGPVATRLSAFQAYQTESAWTWEKMALTRARVVAGSAALGERVHTIIRDVLTAPRDRATTARDVAEMRARIAVEKKVEDVWSLKLVRGGLLDIEFIAQFLQLVHAHDAPDVLQTNTGHAIGALADGGFLEAGAAHGLSAAYALYHEVTQMVRLSLGDPADPRAASESFKRRLARAAGEPDLAVLEATLAETEERVAALFLQIVGEPDAKG